MGFGRGRWRRCGAFLVGVVCAALLSYAPPALAGVANAGLPGAPRGNPLAGMRWGWDTSVHNAAYVAYSRAGGTERSLLAKIALRPTAAWFGPWDPDASAGVMIRSYITAVTGGDPGVLAQLTVFRFDPWEGAACRAAPSSAAQSSYRRWVDSAAAGIGDSRVALILQPDLPFAQCSPGRRAWLGLAGYASQRFSALPHARYADAYVWVGRPWLDYGSNPFDLQRALGLARSSPF